MMVRFHNAMGDLRAVEDEMTRRVAVQKEREAVRPAVPKMAMPLRDMEVPEGTRVQLDCHFELDRGPGSVGGILPEVRLS